MPESSQRIAIVVAVIGVIGTLGAALISNWDKIFAPSPQSARKIDSPQTKQIEPQPPAEPTPRSPRKIDSPQARQTEPRPRAEPISNISGLWRDSDYPSNTSQITQDGNSFHFRRSGVLPNGIRFESSGSGTITGQRFTSNYNARYQSGATSVGDCSGTVSPDRMRLELTCRDSLVGAFPVTAIRQ